MEAQLWQKIGYKKLQLPNSELEMTSTVNGTFLLKNKTNNKLSGNHIKQQKLRN